jgi:hypothetical protein
MHDDFSLSYGRPFTRQQQDGCLASIFAIAQHLAAACHSLRSELNLASIAADLRLVVCSGSQDFLDVNGLLMGALLALFDAVMRVRASDSPSPLSAVYAGHNGTPFLLRSVCDVPCLMLVVCWRY